MGHGTCCAGIAAGSASENGDYIGGIAFNAKLYALKITATDTGTSAYASAIISAWEWCITHQYDAPDHPILVISHSFSGGQYFSQSDCNSGQPLFYAAATAVRAAGITLFVSAGNDGFCESTAKPGCLSNTINVGAVYDSAFGTYRPCVSSDSCVEKYPSPSCGTGYYAEDPTEADRVPSYSNSAAFLTLLAPSNRANTTDISGGGGYYPGNYRSDFGGTSAACPYAAGAAACLQSAALELTGTVLSPDEVEAYLVNNGDPVTDGKSNITTQRVNLRRAIEALTADTPSPIAPPGNFQIVD